MIKVQVEFDDNKVSNRFETFDEVTEWLALVELLHKEKDTPQCIGFMAKDECPEPEPEKEKS